MFAFIIYELKVAVILAAFYLCFKCFLSQEKLHRVNRVVLISTAILSFVLPLCVITVHKTVTVPALVGADLSTSSEIHANVSTLPATVSRFSLELLAIIIYLSGVFAVLTSIIAGVVRVKRLIDNSEKKQMEGSDVMVCDKSVPPFSWMNWIVMCREDYDSGNIHILEHEKAHIRLGHSKDVLLVDILSAFQWFNPAMWLLKKDLRAIHEFEADDAVLRGGANIKEYQYSLIRKAVSASGYSITNSFNHSILKNRITMMSKSNASRMRGLRVLYILPLVCGALALNAKTVTDYKVSENPQNTDETGPKEVVLQLVMNEKDVEYRVGGEKVAFDEIGSKIVEAGGAEVFSYVKIDCDPNLNFSYFRDARQELINAGVTKVLYSNPGTSGIQRRLATSDNGKIIYNETSLGSSAFIRIQINAGDRILYVRSHTGEVFPIDQKDIFSTAKKDIETLNDISFSITTDNATSYGAFSAAFQSIYDAFLAVRNELSIKSYGKPFDELDGDMQDSLREKCKVRITEID
ncbi:MAG: M56 family metallopeptidase [Bacteroidales bacterium]|nr:M56 family metallopeptidase [Bacteroidales bacterium]